MTHVHMGPSWCNIYEPVCSAKRAKCFYFSVLEAEVEDDAGTPWAFFVNTNKIQQQISPFGLVCSSPLSGWALPDVPAGQRFHSPSFILFWDPHATACQCSFGAGLNLYPVKWHFCRWHSLPFKASLTVTVTVHTLLILLVIPTNKLLLLLLTNTRHISSHDATCCRGGFMGLTYITPWVFTTVRLK